jgi:hypothetical protein
VNARALAYASILTIGAVTTWRLLNSLRSAPSDPTAQITRVERVWAASALSLVVSLATDLDPGLGAAFGGLIAFGLLVNPNGPAGALTGTIQKLSQGKLLQQAPSASGGSSSSGAGPGGSLPVNCPPGTAWMGPRFGCVQVAIN